MSKSLVANWRKEDYSGLFYKFDELMDSYILEQNLDAKTIRKNPGYEAMRIAWMVIKSNNQIIPNNLEQIIKENLPDLDNIRKSMEEVINLIGDEGRIPEEFIKAL